MFKTFEFCIPAKGTKVPTGRDWFHEIKYDGYCLRVERNGDQGPKAMDKPFASWSSKKNREDAMGFFEILFGRTSGPAKKLFARFKRKSRAPTDPDLLKIAKDRKGHISRKAVHAEYNRLILEKYDHDKA